MLCGLRIDHVFHAIVGTPTKDGHYSPSRTRSSLRQPLMAFCEVLYADVLTPLFDTVAIVKAKLRVTLERVGGIVAQIITYRPHYHACEDHLQDLIITFHEVYEIMRQCQPGQCFTFQLTHHDLSSTVKRELEAELVDRIDDTLWKLSTGSLRAITALMLPQPLSCHHTTRTCGSHAPLALGVTHTSGLHASLSQRCWKCRSKLVSPSRPPNLLPQCE